MSLAVPLSTAVVAHASPPLLLAGFEADSYAPWSVEGTAFGDRPAEGTLDGQMEVSGYFGHGLVNSYAGGDRSVGRLLSPSFTITAPWLTFLIGGGYQPGRAEIRLLVGGDVVRRATGPNARAGGSERLHPASWDVSELRGREAQIEIVDQAVGGWGHVNVDQISLSARPWGMVANTMAVELDRAYLLVRLPAALAGGWPPCRTSLWIDGREVGLRENSGTTAQWVSFDVRAYAGQRGELDLLLPHITTPVALTSDHPKEACPAVAQTYHEAYRPQYHFTARENWINDPNGLVYYDGEYHLFFQHNPYGNEWGNMTWGHAVSTDLLHWQQLGEAIRPDDLGTVFSGSAVIDREDTSGLRRGASHPPLVCIYTSAGDPFTQSIAYSTDRGRTFAKYEGNPVLGHIVAENRDPKVVWHAPTSRWIMVLYLDGNEYALYSSPDLTHWTHLQNLVLPGSSECPDFFPLPVEGRPGETRWVFWGANSQYMVGSFDGHGFVPDPGSVLRADYGPNLYAAQTWSDIPPQDGRRIQIAWMNGGSYPGMPFNQQMSIPCELTLRATPDGLRLFRYPVRELSGLVSKRQTIGRIPLTEGGIEVAAGELLDLDLRIDPGVARKLVLLVRGLPIEYDAENQTLSTPRASAPLTLGASGLRLRILVDRTSVEVFAQGGLLSLSQCFLPPADDFSVRASAVGGAAVLVGAEARSLQGVWPSKECVRSS